MAELKERTIKIRLTDKDNMALLMKAGECDVSVSDLIQSFVCDLIGSDYSMGSDERMYANEWFRRSNMTNFVDKSFLVYLSENYLLGTMMKELETIDSINRGIEEAKSELADPKYPWDKIVRKTANEEVFAYHSYEEWRDEILEEIDADSDYSERLMEEIKEIWENYQAQKNSASKGFKADINYVREWYIRNTRNMQEDSEKGIR